MTLQKSYDVKWYRKHIAGKGKGNKYSAKSSFYGGLRYHSKFEAEYAAFLDWMIQDQTTGLVDWERQVKLRLCVNDIFITNYFCDFVEIYKDGSRIFSEVKGMETRDWQLKWRLMCAVWPNIEGVTDNDTYQIIKR